MAQQKHLFPNVVKESVLNKHQNLDRSQLPHSDIHLFHFKSSVLFGKAKNIWSDHTSSFRFWLLISLGSSSIVYSDVYTTLHYIICDISITWYRYMAITYDGTEWVFNKHFGNKKTISPSENTQVWKNGMKRQPLI